MALTVEVRTAVLPPLSVSTGQVGLDGQAGGSGSAVWPLVARVVRPAGYVNGVEVAAPWGEPPDWRLFGGLVVIVLGYGAYALFRNFTLTRRI